MPVYHNLYAMHPLLKKGGAHTRSKSGQRSRDRNDLADEAAEYLEEYLQLKESNSESDDLINKVEREQDAPFSLGICMLAILHPVLICCRRQDWYSPMLK